MSKLKRSIGGKSLLLLSVSVILDAGIFFLPAIGALYAGPASILSWLLMSVVAIFISFYFAELVSMFPHAGGIYEFTRRAFGSFAAFLVGWISWIAANITIALLVVGSILYLLPHESLPLKMLLSAVLILFFNAVSYRGINISTKLVLFFGLTTVAALLVLIVPGIFTVSLSNFQPFFVTSLPAVFLTTFFIAEVFFGWEAATYLAEEIKDAQRLLPRALVMSTVIIAALSMLLVFVSLGNARWFVFAAQQAPLTFLAGTIFGAAAALPFTAFALIPLIGSAASWVVSSPRLLYAMSRSKALPGFFGTVHSRHRTPHNAIFFQAAVSILITIAALGSFQLLLSLLIPLVMIMYSVVMLSVVRLRVTMPDAKRYFKAPFPRAGPLLVVLFNAFMIFVWLSQAGSALPVFTLGVILAVAGVPLYILIKLQTDEKFTEKFFNRVSVFWDRLFPIWYSRKDVRRVIDRLGLRSHHNVLDFGCGTGITAAALAKRVPRGSVFAVDISEKQLDHAVDRVRRMNLNNVVLLKQRHLRFRKNSFDAVTAVGVLEYLDNPRSAVENLVSYLKPGGKFSMLSFGRSMGIAAPEHLKNKEDIEKLFDGLPVELRIEKNSKKLTEYWHVWGRKRK
jgi:amino acid transporter